MTETYSETIDSAIKHVMLDTFLTQGLDPYITIDVYSEGVKVPLDLLLEHKVLNYDRYVIFQIGLKMLQPILDLVLDSQGWSGTLSFGGVPYHCVIPWTSIKEFHAGNCYVGFHPTQTVTPVDGDTKSKPEKPSKSSHLRLVK